MNVVMHDHLRIMAMKSAVTPIPTTPAATALCGHHLQSNMCFSESEKLVTGVMNWLLTVTSAIRCNVPFCLLMAWLTNHSIRRNMDCLKHAALAPLFLT